MSKIIITRGLPASGKSTWAKDYQKKHPATVLVNKDELRAMLHNSVYSKGREEMVIDIRDFIIARALHDGKDVIVHDTNLSDKHYLTIKQLFGKLATIEIKDFTDVPLEECIKRDQKRANYVGEKVIRQMYQQFLAKPAVYTPDPALPEAIIVDIDGTLAIRGNRGVYEFAKCEDDLVNEPVKRIVSLYPGKVIICSGREDCYKEQTIRWLTKHGIRFDEIHMRATGDKRQDAIVKGEFWENFLRGNFKIAFVLDDRQQVVDKWRALGLTCLQVADGNF